MRAACLQMNIELCDNEKNSGRALEMAELAIDRGAEILVFPELFLTGFCYEAAPERPPYPSLEPFRDLAEKRDCIIIGSIMNGNLNLGFCLEPGKKEFRPKIHPFGPEKQHFLGGDFIRPISTAKGLIGLEVCYDLRFPEVARSLALQGADFLVTVAQFPAQRIAHWKPLCVARAIENQMPHVACNWAGAGSSMIVDATGEVLAMAGTEEATIIGDIDPEKRDWFRREVPCLKDRRPEIY